ncbi:MAG TPA: vWA domain-containing protein [Polyangiales bacterium]|nr:vWA domain-containing protein [Polyangiales bacterium]
MHMRSLGALFALVLLSCSGDTVADPPCRGNASLCGTTDTNAASNPAGSGSLRDSGLNFGDSGIMLPDAAHQDLEPSGPKVCARSDVVAGRVTPTVVLIIDQSGSMNDSLGSGSRWNVLRDFLLKDDGLIKSMQDKMRFGVAMYSARSDLLNGQPQECPIVTSVTPALNNFNAIADAYRKSEPIDETPTGDSITKILAGLPKPAPDAPVEPTIFVLATDGEPDRCEELNPQNGQAETISAVKAAFDMSIKTFVIGVGAEISKTHQQDVANAGIGHKAGEPNAPYWTAGDDMSLRNALMDIIGAQVSCDIALKGRVEGDACSGTVALSGAPLGCKNPDGWELVDPMHVRLLGKACADFKKQEVSTLNITFPCAAVILE